MAGVEEGPWLLSYVHNLMMMMILCVYVYHTYMHGVTYHFSMEMVYGGTGTTTMVPTIQTSTNLASGSR